VTRLPIPTQVADEALAFAREWVAQQLKYDPFGTGYSLLDQRIGPAWLKHHFKIRAMSHPYHMAEVAAEGRAGWAEAHDALIELKNEFLARGQMPPPQLVAYNIEADHPHLRRRAHGAKKTRQIFQNCVLVVLVQELLVQFPSLKATRSRLSGKQTPTAFSIAVIAFNEAKLGRTLTSGRMEDIWNDPFFR
jgi:hypothetical protein